MIAARNSILGNSTLFDSFKTSFSEVPEVGDTVIVRCHRKVVLKIIKARAGTVFKLFHERYLGHYSKRLTIEFKKGLHCAAKSNKHKIEPKVEQIGE